MFTTSVDTTRAPRLSHLALPSARVPVRFCELTASTLDRAADIELQHGHAAAAERLAERAAVLREAGR